MPWSDLNALLGLPPENPAPRMSPLSMQGFPGRVVPPPAQDMGEVGPSAENIGEVGPVPEHMRPPAPVSTPKSDMLDYRPLVPTPKSARLPMPPGFDAMAQKREQVGTGGAAGQARPEDIAGLAAEGNAAAAPSVRPSVDVSELERKRAMATVLAERGTPAQRVRGKLTLYEVEKEIKRIQEGEAEARQLGIIESAPAAPDAKAKASTLARLGAKTNEIAEALGFDDKGAAREKERGDKMQAYIGARANDARVGSTMQQAMKRSFKLIDESWLATGTPGAVTGIVPGTAAANLRKALEPIQANIGFDRLQQMREQSKTGGALGSIAVRELEFLQAVQGSLDITQSPQVLKENVAAIVKSQQLFARMRTLVPGIEAGDPEAIEAYAALSSQLGTLDADVSRILETKPKLPPRPKGVDDAAILRDAKAALARATPEQRDKIGQQLTEWGVTF